MLQPLSVPLQAGIRFLPPPLPAALSAHFADRFPSTPLACGAGRTTGLPRSADVPEWIGRISTPVAQHLRRRSSRPPDLATYLLVQAVQQLALVLCDDAYDALPGLAIPLDPGSQPPLLLAVAVTAHALAALPREEATLSRRLLAGRIPLAEKRVLSTLSKCLSTATSATSCRTRTPKLSSGGLLGMIPGKPTKWPPSAAADCSSVVFDRCVSRMLTPLCSCFALNREAVSYAGRGG